MLPVFAINLDRHPERWEHISDQLARVGRMRWDMSGPYIRRLSDEC